MNHAANPPYVQIADGLIERIESGELLPGDRLPSERELSERLGITRVTLRQALCLLESQGLLLRKPGAGTFVANMKYECALDQLLPFAQSMKQQGYVLEARLILREEQAVSASMARKLRLPAGAPVYCDQQLWLVNQEPTMLETMLTTERDGEGDDGLVVVTAVQTIEAIAATEYEAAWLGIHTGFPLIIIKRTAYDQYGRALHDAQELYRSDRFRFVGTLSVAAKSSLAT